MYCLPSLFSPPPLFPPYIQYIYTVKLSLSLYTTTKIYAHDPKDVCLYWRAHFLPPETCPYVSSCGKGTVAGTNSWYTFVNRYGSQDAYKELLEPPIQPQ